MSLAHWPPAERPRERLLRHGAAALSDVELLAAFLATGTAAGLAGRDGSTLATAFRRLTEPGRAA